MSETGAEHDNRGAGLDPLVGKVLSGRFRLERLVARGGMGKIYEATQQPLGRTVALKVLDIHDAGDEFRRRFFLEASHCARLTHPNTVRIHDYGETADGIYFIAMEFLRGQTLHQLIEASAPLDPLRVVHIARQVCGALSEAHQAGIIHRDLKPANIFVIPHGDEPDFVKVVDFGLVKELGKESELSRTGHVLGSPLYMAPEQVHDVAVDQRTDIYALGLIMYAMLTGRTAFKRGNPLAVLMAQARATPPSFAEVDPDLRVPASLEWLVQTCIRKSADERPASMREVLRALKACARELRGELTSPLVLRLEEGRIVVPVGLEPSEDVRVPPAAAQRAPRTRREGRSPQAPGSTTLVQRGSSGEVVAPERSQRTRAIVLVGTGGVLALGGGALVLVGLTLLVAWALFAGTRPEPAEAPPVAPVATPMPAPTTPAPPPPEAVEVEIALTSAPPGAEVERDGVLLGTTPLSLRIPEGEEWIVDVRAAGFLPRTVRLASDQPTLSVSLERRPIRPAPTAPHPAPVADPEPAPVEAAPEPPPAPRRRGDIRNPWE